MQSDSRQPDTITALSLIRTALRNTVRPGELCIDATAGRGYDTLFLSTLTGDSGRVLAFDIQPEAIASTQERLHAAGRSNVRLFLESHIHMDQYCPLQSASAIMFNFGWLPGGSHSVMTRPDTSLAAIQKGLPLLRHGGLMTLAVYSGKDTGFAERDAILNFLPQIDSREYTVLRCDFANRGGNPPLPVLIYRAR